MKKLVLPPDGGLQPENGKPRPPTDKKGMARWLGRNVRTIDNYIANGELPCFRLGGVVLFDLDVVAAHFKARCKVNGNK